MFLDCSLFPALLERCRSGCPAFGGIRPMAETGRSRPPEAGPCPTDGRRAPMAEKPLSFLEIIGEVPEWFSRLWRDPSYGGNGTVSPARGGSLPAGRQAGAYGGKTVELFGNNRRGAGVVYRGGLENRCAVRYPGFESRPLRHCLTAMALSLSKGQNERYNSNMVCLHFTLQRRLILCGCRDRPKRSC